MPALIRLSMALGIESGVEQNLTAVGAAIGRGAQVIFRWSGEHPQACARYRSFQCRP